MLIKSLKPIDSAEYKNHKIFSTLDEMINFYKSLSFSIFSFVTLGTKAICNIDSYLYSSVQGTLESIKNILKNGRINDAYALLRKYHDSSVINIYSNLYLKDNFRLENLIVEKINDWLKGKEKLPRYGEMCNYIKKSPKLKELKKALYQDKRYEKIRNRCNDHTHYNFYQYVLYNDNEIHLKDRIKALDIFLYDIDQIFIWHLSYLFYLNEHYMMSSDYLDSIEMGITPEEDSQYLVAPFVQKIFNNFVKCKRPDLARIIKLHTEMKLE